jgi:hypothetical protein
VSCSYASMPILHTIQQPQIYCGQAFVGTPLNLTCSSLTYLHVFFWSHEHKIVIGFSPPIYDQELIHLATSRDN